ncbi:MAG: hypothetical protein HY899_17425 [Deltaproteobacteria bacterium]|nr:hypothetical protein [Deltaproteobacteria bacterium]
MLASYYASRPGPAAHVAGLERAATLVPENWRYFLELGQILAAFGEYAEAIARYRKAIANYPACAVCWMSLAEAQAALGQDPSEAIENAVATGRSHPTTRLRAATLYAMLGRDQEAGREFAAAQRGIGEGGDDLYDTLHRLYTADFLVDHVFVGEDLIRYFGFVLQHRPLADARVVWARAARDGVEIRDWQRVAYSKSLLRSGQVHEAWEARFAGGPAAAASVLDGDFEQVKDNKPFGWYLTPGDGVLAEVASCDDCLDGERALHLVFDGKHNPHYAGVWQDVAVEPGAAYLLRGNAKAEHITSASGPRVAVRGIARHVSGGGAGGDCGLWAAGPEWKLASAWREFRIEFRVPAGCEGIRVLVTRASTDQFNKFLGGELWIDAVSLTEAAAGG